jgi:hypothetical protein
LGQRPAVHSSRVDDEKFLPTLADTVIFDPANWADIIDDPMAIPRGLENCRQAYRSLCDLYDAVSPEEQKTLFPDGLPEP